MPDDRILDTCWQGFTLKAMEREKFIPGVFGNGQSESDIRYKKLSQLCGIMPADKTPVTLPDNARQWYCPSLQEWSLQEQGRQKWALGASRDEEREAGFGFQKLP
ncbi:hypothetical protein TNCV_2495241 [Trichonephila clavipes]|nr:hypothetical protein TNCV_2495241 [Trichonephila clavipes]